LLFDFNRIEIKTLSKTKINRRQFIQQAAVASAALGLSSLPNSTFAGNKDNTSSPNVIFILADDLGWGDLSSYGRRDYSTPNLDKLATQGVRLTQAYSNSSYCTPTRIAFLTGRYQQKTPVGLQEPLPYRKQLEKNGSVEKLGIPAEHPTIASYLKKQGYNTGLVGKWHAGYLPNFSPLKSGFDQFFGVMSGGVDYFTHKDSDGENDLWEDETPIEKTGYITDLITERAIEFIDSKAKAKQPFYLSLHYTAPHWPWEGPKDEEISQNLKSLFHFDGGSPEIYAEMVKRLDSGVGKVLNTLTKLGIADNTLVIFTSDNGGERFSDMFPFVGSKGGVYEGSTRVPAIIRWPKQLPANKISQQVAVSFDWTATILAAAKVSTDSNYPLDGIDLLPYLKTAGKNETTVERQLFWRVKGQHAVRDGNLKYIKVANENQVFTQGGLPASLRGTEFLFDLSQDLREQANLKDQRPADLQRLRQAWEAWNKTVLAEPVAT
jgi:arylsulfatase A-like enzyme